MMPSSKQRSSRASSTGPGQYAVELPPTLHARRVAADERLARLRRSLIERGAAELVGDHTCVYATGSFGRGEASRQHSDLDLFIIKDDFHRGRKGISKLGSIELRAHLIQATREAGFPEFSNDGEYLTVHSLKEMKAQLGNPLDDYTNAFTARMLLLLESRPLLGESTYDRVIKAVVNQYWRDYEDHKDDFQPLFLTNDIIRYWKVLCLNYEAKPKPKPTARRETAKRRISNYKLKHSRLLICYSAVIYLAWVYGNRMTTSPRDAISMVRLRPCERLARIAAHVREAGLSEGIGSVVAPIDAALDFYQVFLEETDAERETVIARFSSQRYHELRRKDSRYFGEELFATLAIIAGQSKLFRYLVI